MPTTPRADAGAEPPAPCRGPEETHDEPICAVPTLLGPCRILRRLGGGSSGSVHLAEVTMSRPWAEVGTRVAVKVLAPPACEDPIAFARFRREAELGMELEHPGSLRTLACESCRVEDRTWHFLVMDWADGQTFRDLMEQMQVVPEALLRDLGVKVARALQGLHARGVIHRDIKPENAFILPGHEVKLGDFGSACRLDAAGLLTAPGRFVGSPLYAAPEQFRDGELSPATDLYALGVLLYEAATGTQPFAAEGLRAVMRRHFEHRPQPARKLNPRLTPFFEEILACLLEKDPGLRFRRAENVAEVLETGEASDWWRERESAALSAGRSRPGARPWQPRETSLIGREAELSVLGELLSDARHGRGRLLLLEGELGVGKSRLLDEFLRRLEDSGDDLHVLHGSNSPALAGNGLGALAGGVVAHFGDTLLEKRLSPYLRVTPDLVPSFAALLKGLPLPSGAEPLSQEALHSLTCNLVGGLASEKPVVWIMEDLHFASTAMRSLLGSLARSIDDLPVLLIATARTEPTHLDQGVELDRLELTRRLRLQRLGPQEVRRLAGEALQSELLADQLSGPLLAKTGGNPFFVLQVLRELKEKGVLRQLPDSTWIARRDLEAVALPGSVRGLILSRLGALAEEDRQLLDAAAVEGFAFDAHLVARVLGRDRLAVLQSLARLEREHGLVRAAGAGFVFDNPLLREGLLEELPPLLAAEYHRLLAGLLLARVGPDRAGPEDVPGDVAVAVVVHALGAQDLELGRALIDRALEHLSSSYAHDTLLSLGARLRAALGEKEPALRCSVQLREVACLDMTGRLEEARDAVEDAIAAASSAGDEGLLLRAQQVQGRLLASLGDHGAARRFLESVVEGAVSSGARTVEARATKDLGAVLALTGRHALARTCFERSLQVAREVGDARTEAASTSNLGSCLKAEGRPEEALVLYERSLATCRRHGHRDLEAIAMINLGAIHFDLGHVLVARGWLEQSLDLARSLGRRSSESIALINLGHLGLQETRFEEAGRLLARGVELLTALGSRQHEGLALLRCGDLERARGRLDEAQATYERALELLRAVGSAEGEAEASLALGRCLAERGDRSPAVALLEHAERLTTELSYLDNGVLPSAWLALLGHRDPVGLEVAETAPIAVRAEAHAVLHRAGGDEAHAARAGVLLREIGSHLEAEAREHFWSQHPTARLLGGKAGPGLAGA